MIAVLQANKSRMEPLTATSKPSQRPVVTSDRMESRALELAFTWIVCASSNVVVISVRRGLVSPMVTTTAPMARRATRARLSHGGGELGDALQAGEGQERAREAEQHGDRRQAWPVQHHGDGRQQMRRSHGNDHGH